MSLPVSPISPKAEPVLYAVLVRLLILGAARIGLTVTDASATEAAGLLTAAYVAGEAIISWIVRSRVSPVTSTGTLLPVNKGN